MDRILIIDHKAATPDRDSGSLRMVHLIKVLTDLGLAVTYLPQTRNQRTEHQRLLQLAGSLGMEIPPERSVARHLKRNPSTYRAALLCRLGPAERTLPVLRRCAPKTWAIFDTVDLHHLRELRQSEIEGNARLKAHALEVRRRELLLVERVDATVVVSTAERDLLQKTHPDRRIQVVTNIHEIARGGPSWEDRSGLLFVAGFEHAPNVDAALWLVESVMPLVHKRLPEVPLTLVGSQPPRAVERLQRSDVEVTGWVPEIEPYLNRSRLSLAPLRYGAGVKGKITQSMAAGLPVVATRLAAEGMPIEDERDILMADGAEDLAAAIVEAYLDKVLWNRLAANGRDAAMRYFSFNAARRAVEVLLSDLPSRVGGDK